MCNVLSTVMERTVQYCKLCNTELTKCDVCGDKLTRFEIIVCETNRHLCESCKDELNATN